MKRMEAFNVASLGNRLDGGSVFHGTPDLPHGIKGIFISDKAEIGYGCRIWQQVTVGVKTPDGGAPVIGNNVELGSGCKVIGSITVGDNVKVGANCVVTKNVPSGCTVVLSEQRLIIHTQ